MKKYSRVLNSFVAFFLLLISHGVYSQSITGAILNCTGTTYTNVNNSLEQSVGELSIKTYTSTANILSQGLLQSETFVFPALATSVSSLSYVEAGEAKTINVTSNVNWTAVSSVTWLTLNTGSGSGNASVNATASANTVTAIRTALITFSAGTITKQVTVSQAVSTLSIDETKNDSEISFYPNPAKESLFISANLDQVASIKIYNTVGKIIYNKENTNGTVDISSFSEGIYFLISSDKNNIKTASFKFQKATN